MHAPVCTRLMNVTPRFKWPVSTSQSALTDATHHPADHHLIISDSSESLHFVEISEWQFTEGWRLVVQEWERKTKTKWKSNIPNTWHCHTLFVGLYVSRLSIVSPWDTLNQTMLWLWSPNSPVDSLWLDCHCHCNGRTPSYAQWETRRTGSIFLKFHGGSSVCTDCGCIVFRTIFSRIIDTPYFIT